MSGLIIDPNTGLKQGEGLTDGGAIEPCAVYVLRRSTDALDYGAPSVQEILSAYPSLLIGMRGHRSYLEPKTRNIFEVVILADPSDDILNFKEGFLTEGKFKLWEAFTLESITKDGHDGTTSMNDLVDSLMEKVKNVKGSKG